MNNTFEEDLEHVKSEILIKTENKLYFHIILGYWIAMTAFHTRIILSKSKAKEISAKVVIFGGMITPK